MKAFLHLEFSKPSVCSSDNRFAISYLLKYSSSDSITKIVSHVGKKQDTEEFFR